MRGKVSSGVIGFLISSIGAIAGMSVVPRPTWPGQPPDTILDSLINWDGRWYYGIVESGYAYSASEKSNLAFFPAYPVSVAAFGFQGHSIKIGAPLVSSLAFLASLLMAFDYCQQRSNKNQGVAALAALSLALFPAGFFFRMAYSEAVFLSVCLLYFTLAAHKAAAEYLALACGLSSAVRPVGIVLLAPLLMTLWAESKTLRSFLFQAAILIIPATWGILLFTAYQWDVFGDPFAWVKAQAMWRNTPPVPWTEKLIALLSLEPIWASYIPGTEFYWHQPGQPDFPLFSLRFVNPIFFVAAVALVSIGGYKRWLNAQELVFSVGLLAIPYVTRGYDMCMESQARFTSVVFPVYMVIGILLSKVSRPWQIAYFAVSAFFLCAYTAFFCAGYVFI